MKNGFMLIAAALCTAICAQLCRGEEDLRAEITVNTLDVLGNVPPFVFGHNVEAADSQFIFGKYSNPTPGRTGDGVWDPIERRPAPELAAAAREIGVKMIRYPGGCLVHNFDWHKAVGPLSERPDYTFGIDEVIAYCRAIGAAPLITTSAYVGGPRDMADLVEYCNAPADDNYPWATKRAAWGHPAPYGVVYFEMGNESDHGNHDVKPFRKHTAESYAKWFVESSKLMRAVDPNIKLGALMGTATGPDDPWNAKVLTLAKDHIDYVIVHTYAVGLWQKAPENEDRVMRAAMAAGDQFEVMLAKYRRLIRRCTGGDLPLAITEYNAAYVQEKPKPYRFSMAGALFSADYVRVLLKPENNILMANYWHFVNGYWGMLRGPRVPRKGTARWKRMPAFYLYRLWGSHFGDLLIHTQVRAPKLEFEGCLRVSPARSDSSGYDVDLTPTSGTGRGHAWEAGDDGSMTLRVKDFTGEAYPIFARVKVPGGRTIRLSFECRTKGEVDATGKFGIGVIDGRGWFETRSGLGVDNIQKSRTWEKHSGKMVTLQDCRGVTLTWRLICKGAPISALIEARNMKLSVLPDFPPYNALTACSSLSEDGQILYLVVFNKHHKEDIETRITVKGKRIRSCRYWAVTAPSLDAMNLRDEVVRETVSGEAVHELRDGTFTHIFPKISMTAFEMKVE